MGRRGTGLGVLLLALSVAIIVPNLAPKHIPGTATATLPQPPPAIGDCVLQAFDMTNEMVATPNGWQPNYPHPTTGSCRGTIFGQISAVIADPSRVSNAPDSSGGDPNYARCPGNASYEDLPAGSDAGTAYGHWHVQLLTNTTVIQPSARQAAAGQHWVACTIAVIQNQAAGIDPNLINQARGFPAPINQWRRSRQIAEAIGQCILSTSPSIDSSTDCSTTHSAESFGYNTAPPTPELTAACHALIKDLTAMPDPTAGGRLQIQVLNYDANGDQVTSVKQRTPTDTRQVCMITSDGRSNLKGALLALGDEPVPFG